MHQSDPAAVALGDPIINIRLNRGMPAADGEVVRIGAKLTELTDEQAEYIGVRAEGPYKPDTYRY